jgi:hypothetical protein
MNSSDFKLIINQHACHEQIKVLRSKKRLVAIQLIHLYSYEIGHRYHEVSTCLQSNGDEEIHAELFFFNTPVILRPWI